MRTPLLFMFAMLLIPCGALSQSTKQLSERYYIDTLDNNYIPFDLHDALAQIPLLESQKDISEFARIPEDSLIYRYSILYRVREAWQFDRGSRLTRYLAEQGIRHREYGYLALLTAFHRQLNNKPVVAEEIFAEYRTILGGLRREHEWRVQRDTLDSVYIPCDLHDCFLQLEQLFSAEFISDIRNRPNAGETALYHHDLGMWMRNNWSLWGGSRLSDYLQDMGLDHPDNMSGFILKLFWYYLNNDPHIEDRISELLYRRKMYEDLDFARCPVHSLVMKEKSGGDVRDSAETVLAVYHGWACPACKEKWFYQYGRELFQDSALAWKLDSTSKAEHRAFLDHQKKYDNLDSARCPLDHSIMTRYERYIEYKSRYTIAATAVYHVWCCPRCPVSEWIYEYGKSLYQDSALVERKKAERMQMEIERLTEAEE